MNSHVCLMHADMVLPFQGYMPLDCTKGTWNCIIFFRKKSNVVLMKRKIKEVISISSSFLKDLKCTRLLRKWRWFKKWYSRTLCFLSQYTLENWWMFRIFHWTITRDEKNIHCIYAKCAVTSCFDIIYPQFLSARVWNPSKVITFRFQQSIAFYSDTPEKNPSDRLTVQYYFTCR